MVFKGFTDENGNVIPVQGAGTVYNEEKNSLALGKDTVAIGQDQLVFGRVNATDANKAEIVGAGFLKNTEYKAQYWTNMNDYSHIVFKIGETKSELERYLSQRLGRQITVSGWRNDIKGVFLDHNNMATMIILYFDLSHSKFTAGDSCIYLAVYIPNITNNEISLEGIEPTNGIKSVTGESAPSLEYIEMYKLYYAPEYLKTSTFERVPKNIRTLDWDGTQWNAGDLTCDDGEGNTISMRDLLSRIATLEAAAAAAAEE